MQESLDAVRVLIVPAPGYDERTEADIEARLRARAGNAFVIRFEQVSSIPRGAQGKLQTIRSLLTEPERV